MPSVGWLIEWRVSKTLAYGGDRIRVKPAYFRQFVRDHLRD